MLEFEFAEAITKRMTSVNMRYFAALRAKASRDSGILPTHLAILACLPVKCMFPYLDLCMFAMTLLNSHSGSKSESRIQNKVLNIFTSHAVERYLAGSR